MLSQTDAVVQRLRCRTQLGISLVEVLVVCAIVLFLLALLVPGLGHAKDQARRVQCANNLRQWGVALQFFRNDHNDYIPMEGTQLSGGISKPGTWFNELPPYLEMPAYRDVAGVNISIEEFKNGHVWFARRKTSPTPTRASAARTSSIMG